MAASSTPAPGRSGSSISRQASTLSSPSRFSRTSINYRLTGSSPRLTTSPMSTSLPTAAAPSSQRVAKSSPCPPKLVASSRSLATPTRVTAARASFPTARAFLPYPLQPAKLNSGNIPRTASARQNNGPTMPKSFAGMVSLLPMATGLPTSTRTIFSGSTT